MPEVISQTCERAFKSVKILLVSSFSLVLVQVLLGISVTSLIFCKECLPKCERIASQLFLFSLTSFIHFSVFLDQRFSQLRELWKRLRAVTLKGRIHESNISQIPTFENTQWRKAAQTEFMRAISVKWSAALNSNSLAHPNIRSCYSNFPNPFKFQTF